MTSPRIESESEDRTLSPTLLFGLVLVSVVILLTPIPAGMTPAGHRLLAVATLMAGLWMTQAIPIAATSLLPLALFPLFGIQTAKDTARSYAEDSLFLYIGGMIIALGIERWNLHRRMALTIVNLVGVSPRRLVIGFSIATFTLSMWISNTATTMLMLPIGLAMLKVIDEVGEGEHRSSALAVPLLLTLAYSATLGGMATPVGSPTNSVAIGIYQSTLKDAPPVYFSEWLLSCGPIALVYAAIVVAILIRKLPYGTTRDGDLKLILKQRLSSLGRMTTAERLMTGAFGLTAVLWVTRDKILLGDYELFGGWQRSFGRFAAWITGETAAGNLWLTPNTVSDATVAMFMAVLLFVLPSGQRDSRGRFVPLMDWSTASRLPWDMILLFGGGFALANAFETTKLAAWLAATLKGPLQSYHPAMVVAIICFILVMLTELTSNVATVNAVLPAILVLAEPLHMDPRMLFVPATLAASAGFMLPVGTPPNAIVFSTGRIPSAQMARQGLILNLIGVPLLTLGTWLLIRPIMGIK
ncbi:MAG: anion permease [Planctomycetaceae bacterium]|nr:anion permease [Planctomycetaceae bacterium]